MTTPRTSFRDLPPTNMLLTFCCLLLSYLAIVAQVMGGPLESVSRHFPAMVVVLAARWFSPSVAAVWAFVIGLALDAVGIGSLGVHATLLVLIVAVLSPGDVGNKNPSGWVWMRAVFFAAFCDSLILPVIDFCTSQHWQPLQDASISCGSSAFLTAAAVGLFLGISRSLIPRPRWMEG